MGQYESLEVGEDLLTMTKSTSQLPTKLEELGNDIVGADIMREDMANIWSTEEFWGQDEREILVCHHRLNHFSFKSLLI